MIDEAMQQRAPEERIAQPLGLLEIGFLYGGLAFLIDGFSLVLTYGLHPFFAGLQCFLPLIYIAAGFTAARYTAVANGVWAAIMVAALDTICGMGLLLFLQRAEMAQAAELMALLPSTALALIIPITVVGIVVRVIIGGLIWGGIGGKLAQSFRPRRLLR